MTIDELCAEVHDLAKSKGWWPGERAAVCSIPEKLCLIHSEISEALEAYRENAPLDIGISPEGKPEGFGVELADAVIRICDLYEALRRDLPALHSLGELIEMKHRYNATRAFRHGGKRA